MLSATTEGRCTWSPDGPTRSRCEDQRAGAHLRHSKHDRHVKFNEKALSDRVRFVRFPEDAHDGKVEQAECHDPDETKSTCTHTLSSPASPSVRAGVAGVFWLLRRHWRSKSPKPALNPEELEDQAGSERIREIATYSNSLPKVSDMFGKEPARGGWHLRAIRRGGGVRSS